MAPVCHVEQQRRPVGGDRRAGVASSSVSVANATVTPHQGRKLSPLTGVEDPPEDRGGAEERRVGDSDTSDRLFDSDPTPTMLTVAARP